MVEKEKMSSTIILYLANINEVCRGSLAEGNWPESCRYTVFLEYVWYVLMAELDGKNYSWPMFIPLDIVKILS